VHGHRDGRGRSGGRCRLGILVGSGPELAFRHLLIQQALYGSMPAALRTALHAEAARELAAAGADLPRLLQQVLFDTADSVVF